MKKSGFTLLEILLVVGIIAILAGIVIMALNPTKMLSQTRNVQRKANLAELNKALYQYYIDHSHYPANLTTTLTEICATGASSTPTGIVCTGLIDLSPLVPTYLVSIPTDPQGSTLSLIPIAYATTNGTGYKVMKNSDNKIVLEATQAEWGAVITVGSYTNCGLTLTDARDGKQYGTVLIGNQCWMQQNLNVGTMIAGINNQGVSTTSIQKYCYLDNEANCTLYGGLYQWDQMMGSSTIEGVQGICPIGWHVPMDAEYKTLIEGQATSGCESSFGWQCSPAGSHLSNLTLNHDNSSDFTALLAGYRLTDGSYNNLGSYMFLWSSHQSNTSAWRRHLFSNFATVNRDTLSKAFGFSVRCLKD